MKRSPKRILDDVLWRFKEYDLTNHVCKHGAAIARGGYFDVYQGRLGPHQTLVAIRQLQHMFNDGDDIAKSIAQEIRIWSHLRHPNILPFLGYTQNCGPFPACVSEWMANGTAEEYLKRNPSTSYLPIVHGVAKGIRYLHSQNVVHSDLKAANILISDTGQALLADFGVSRHLQLSRSIVTTKDHTGSLRWMAIEYFDFDDDAEEADNASPRAATMDTDLWAFGLTALEIATGKVPYDYIKMEGQILFAIIHRKPPFKSRLSRNGSDMDDGLWALCQRCVNIEPRGRPRIDAIVGALDLLLSQGDNTAHGLPRAQKRPHPEVCTAEPTVDEWRTKAIRGVILHTTLNVLFSQRRHDHDHNEGTPQEHAAIQPDLRFPEQGAPERGFKRTRTSSTSDLMTMPYFPQGRKDVQYPRSSMPSSPRAMSEYEPIDSQLPEFYPWHLEPAARVLVLQEQDEEAFSAMEQRKYIRNSLD